MSSDAPEIALVGRIESAGLDMVLARTTAADDRRIENWIACNLDAEPGPTGALGWDRLIGDLPGARMRKNRPAPSRGAAGASSGWSRFTIAYRRGVTVVRLVDRALVERRHIEELGQDLLELIEVGNHRIVLNFTIAERLGSWIIGAVGAAHRRCAAADGGMLKLCGLDPALAEIFSIVGMARELALYPDETSALESPWPEPRHPRQLPVDILSALFAMEELRPIEGGAPTSPDEEESASSAAVAARAPAPPPLSPSSSPAPGAEQGRAGARVRLRVRAESGHSRTITIAASRFLIGRDAQCQLRLGSAQVSKRHAAIEQREGRVFLRDLGSTNGTRVNGQPVHTVEQELRHGDQVQIGPAQCTLLFGGAAESADMIAEMVSEWAERDETAPEPDPAPASAPARAADDAPADLRPTDELPLFDDADPDGRIRVEVVEDVLVVTPQFPELESESVLGALRSRLQALQDEPLPRRVVLNLEFVNHLSRQAVAVLVAHHLRLDWSGGALRLCQAHARILALLDQVRLTMLVDCYPTLDEAVLAAWSRKPRGDGRVRGDQEA